MAREMTVYDLVVIGGGVNGAGIAADAAGRGLNVLLCEQNDLASATSSSSSKLIHGGLRYLEQYEFRLVREALAEREVLINKAPHIISPLRFRLPHQPHLRPAWMIRAGLFLYDNLSKRVTLKGSHGVRFDDDSPLDKGANITRGFEYSDGWVDDARLVILNAIDARNHNADVRTRTRCIKAERKKDTWQVTLLDTFSEQTEQVQCRVLVNATGPWVNHLFEGAIQKPSPKGIRLIRGSHIVVPKLHDQPEAYILQNNDHRIVFVIPYEDDFSLVGTTDVEHKASLDSIRISAEETDYLLTIINDYFQKKTTREDIISSYSGVRPLLDDDADNPQAVTRDYTLELDADAGQPPLLSIFGGKITTYRKLAENAVDKLAPFFPAAGPAWTSTAPLAGGDFTDRATLQAKLKQQYPWLADSLCARLTRCYGTIAYQVLDGVTSAMDMGVCIGGDFYERELKYLVEQEWACTVEDVLWRRTKLGLRFDQAQQDLVASLMASIINSESEKRVVNQGY